MALKRLYWNDKVKVKLTDHGKDIYYHRFDGLTSTVANVHGARPILEPSYPKVDEDGYSTFQLWHFMEIFGKHIGMAKPNVVEGISFYIDDDDLMEVESNVGS